METIELSSMTTAERDERNGNCVALNDDDNDVERYVNYNHNIEEDDQLKSSNAYKHSSLNKNNDIKAVTMNVDGFLRMVGEFGRFQILMEICFVFMIVAPVSQIYLLYFTAPELDWTCVKGSSQCFLNGTQPSTNDFRCNISRSEWEFVQDEGTKTVTAQFDLYCGSTWLIHMSSSIMYFGKLFGTFIMGWLADIYGRKTILYPSYAFLLSVSLLATVMPNIWLFLACRFLTGFTMDAASNQILLTLSEFVSTRYRPLATNILWAGWIATVCFLPLLGYYIRDWKTLFLVSALPYFIGLLSYWFIPESVRWLRTEDRLDEAHDVFKRIAKWNRKEIDEKAALSKPLKTDVKRTTPLDLLKRNMIVSTLAQGVLWFVNGLVYYGLASAAGDLGGSMYLNFFYLSLAEIPSAICASYMPGRWGRRITTIVSLFLAGAFCIAVPFIPLTEHGKPTRVAVGILGKFFLTLSYDVISIWSVELFPTNVRSKGLSWVYMAANVGSTASPWIAQGLKVYSEHLPFLIMGGSALFGAFAGLALEETKGKDAKDTIEESFGSDNDDDSEGVTFCNNKEYEEQQYGNQQC